MTGAERQQDAPARPGDPYPSTWAERGIDVSVVHPARRYDYWLGGKDNFEADRASGDAIAAAMPSVRIAVRENRKFLARAVSFLAGEAGITQFLDIGTGIPAADNTHEVAQRVDPAARVVYVDNDPIVLAHARALLTSTGNGATAYIDADLRSPERILADPALTRTLDLGRPVALMLIAVLHFLQDDDRPYEIVRTLVDALPAGSYLAISHATADLMPAEVLAGLQAIPVGSAGGRLRTRAEMARFFEGLDMVEPGVVPTCDWRAPASGTTASPADVGAFAAVARIR